MCFYCLPVGDHIKSKRSKSMGSDTEQKSKKRKLTSKCIMYVRTYVPAMIEINFVIPKSDLKGNITPMRLWSFQSQHECNKL